MGTVCSMNCQKPFTLDGGAYGCGHCVPCRVKKRREWQHRMMLEAAQYGDNAFITLTYAPEHQPEDQSVSPRISSLFIKKLRKRGFKFRYFLVGEYGDQNGLPHYHAALFDFPTCLHGGTRYYADPSRQCCRICEAISEAWGFGRIHVGSLTPQSMAYVAGYINKKMTRETDPRLEGRRPEFARMSLRPGLGLGMMHDLASTLMEHSLERKLIDVPAVLQHGRVTYPLGRYLRRKLRTFIGRQPNTPQEAINQQKEKLHPLREAAFQASKPFKTAILEASEGRRIQIEAHYRRRNKRYV